MAAASSGQYVDAICCVTVQMLAEVKGIQLTAHWTVARIILLGEMILPSLKEG
jgi:hypothetical protein